MKSFQPGPEAESGGERGRIADAGAQPQQFGMQRPPRRGHGAVQSISQKKDDAHTGIVDELRAGVQAAFQSEGPAVNGARSP